MKKFLSILALFFVPILIFYGIFGFALYQSGEWRSEEEIVQRIARGEPAFLGLAHRDNNLYYKHLTASSQKADLLILGTSRSMQFSSHFFSQPSFYNAGGAANYTNAYRFFLENLPPEAMPETLVMVFDQYFFQEDWSNIASWPALDFSHSEFSLKTSLPRIIRDWGAGKFRLGDMLRPPQNTYGIAAVGRGSGFYADGSYCYGSLVDHPENGTDVGFHDSFLRIREGNRRFEWADNVYDASLEEIARLMQLCYEKDIQVVGIIPPYAPSVWQAMEGSGKYGYIAQIQPRMQEIMEPYGYEIFDYTYMPDTKDAEYIDGYHGGDRVYARIALDLADKSEILSGQIDTEYLKKALAPNDNPLRLTA